MTYLGNPAAARWQSGHLSYPCAMKDSACANALPLPKHDRTAWLRGGTALCEQPARTPAGKPWRLVLLGAPGVGKGTQAELLHQRLGACHLSTGDVFRAAKSDCHDLASPAMADALRFMRRGALVPDDTVLSLLGERLRCLNCSGGFLLDGFPRTVAQAEALELMLAGERVELDAVLNYEMPIATIVKRLSGRRTCEACKAVYHVTTRPPKADGLCDHCGGHLLQREDDRPESVSVRMQAYQTSNRPLMDFYRERGILISIPADGLPEEIYERTRRLMFAH